VFGTDPARHKALSPLTHVGGRDAPQWLMLHVAERAATTRQAGTFAAALTKAGRSATIVPLPGTNHMRINREIGTDAGSAQTQAIDAFLARAVRP